MSTNNTDRFSTPMEMTLKKAGKKNIMLSEQNMGPESDRGLVRESSDICAEIWRKSWISHSEEIASSGQRGAYLACQMDNKENDVAGEEE